MSPWFKVCWLTSTDTNNNLYPEENKMKTTRLKLYAGLLIICISNFVYGQDLLDVCGDSDADAIDLDVRILAHSNMTLAKILANNSISDDMIAGRLTFEDGTIIDWGDYARLPKKNHCTSFVLKENWQAKLNNGPGQLIMSTRELPSMIFGTSLAWSYTGPIEFSVSDIKNGCKLLVSVTNPWYFVAYSVYIRKHCES
jgi:hypothetical protein